jgi:hypothetical protein
MYVNSTITALEKSVEGTSFVIRKPIKFNLAVVNVSEKGGGLKIYIATAKGKLNSSQTTHIEFEVEPKRGKIKRKR